MTRLLSIAALLLVSACDQAEQPPAPAPTAAEAPGPAPVAKAAIPSLKGQWRVTAPASVDLFFGDRTATLSSGCVRRGFTYTQTGNQISFASAPSGSANCGNTPSGPTETAASALVDANLAVFDKDGSKVTLSGLGGILTLERR